MKDSSAGAAAAAAGAALAITATSTGFLSRGARERLGAAVSWLPGATAEMQELAEQVASAATADRLPVLVVGERGTGKGRVARLIHCRGPRAAGALVEVNCAALAPIGEDGAATVGALAASAREGTLFLDEVGELPPSLQGAVLKVLAGEHGDVRVIAATRRDLVEAVTDGAFREDLYYRLGVMPIHLPPLRARARMDLAALVADVVDDLAAELPEAPRAVAAATLEQLVRLPWPENVRGLRNVLERAMLAGRGSALMRPEHLPADARGSATAPAEHHAPRSLADVEREHVGRTLQEHHGNRTHAARELGISRATLIKKVREYGLAPARNARDDDATRERT